jgi:hypothetical protein
VNEYKIPAGWVRGEDIVWIGCGPRYAVFLNRALGAAMTDVACIKFSSLDESKDFDRWWKEDADELTAE